mmetsp:Transcript_71583/g.207492  ORF Transcript_71583/g.207492 Transcript_71583/m.207492 type:complete len:105 (+) Transcript_71583:1-315(+)
MTWCERSRCPLTASVSSLGTTMEVLLSIHLITIKVDRNYILFAKRYDHPRVMMTTTCCHKTFHLLPDSNRFQDRSSIFRSETCDLSRKWTLHRPIGWLLQVNQD